MVLHEKKKKKKKKAGGGGGGEQQQKNVSMRHVRDAKVMAFQYKVLFLSKGQGDLEWFKEG